MIISLVGARRTGARGRLPKGMAVPRRVGIRPVPRGARVSMVPRGARIPSFMMGCF